MSVELVVVTLLAGSIVGAMSAFFGVGGGLLMVPFMVLVLSSSQHVAEGTSLVVIVPTAVAGVVAHSRRGLVDFRLSGWLSVGGVIGAVLGAGVALGTNGALLRLLFGILVIGVGIRFIYQGVTADRGSEPD